MKKKTQEHEWTINIVSYSFGIFLRAILLPQPCLYLLHHEQSEKVALCL